MLEKQTWPVCRGLFAAAEAEARKDSSRRRRRRRHMRTGWNVGHLESPKPKTTNATKFEIGSAGPKPGPLPPGVPGLLVPLGDYVRPAMVALTNLMVGMARLCVLPIRVSGRFPAEGSAALTSLLGALWPRAPSPAVQAVPWAEWRGPEAPEAPEAQETRTGENKVGGSSGHHLPSNGQGPCTTAPRASAPPATHGSTTVSPASPASPASPVHCRKN